jgi:hypothetical protein
MYSTLRPEGLASGSAKASVAMEANKIRADFMTSCDLTSFLKKWRLCRGFWKQGSA